MISIIFIARGENPFHLKTVVSMPLMKHPRMRMNARMANT